MKNFVLVRITLFGVWYGFIRSSTRAKQTTHTHTHTQTHTHRQEGGNDKNSLAVGWGSGAREERGERGVREDEEEEEESVLTRRKRIWGWLARVR